MTRMLHAPAERRADPPGCGYQRRIDGDGGGSRCRMQDGETHQRGSGCAAHRESERERASCAGSNGKRENGRRRRSAEREQGGRARSHGELGQNERCEADQRGREEQAADEAFRAKWKVVGFRHRAYSPTRVPFLPAY